MRFGCIHDIGTSVQVSYRGRELFRYVYRAAEPQVESPRPYFHPVRTLGGEVVTTFRPHDHLWHRGLAWSLPHVGPENFWGGPTFYRGEGYVQRDNNGSMNHQRLTALDVTADGVRLRHALAWVTQAGQHIVDEDRTVTATMPGDDSGSDSSPGDGRPDSDSPNDGRIGDDHSISGVPGEHPNRDYPATWVMGFETAMTNVSGSTIMLGSPTTAGRENAGYGGLFWRGPRSFTSGTLLAPGRAGGDELRGERAAWMGFTGRHDETGAASTLVMVDHPANPRHPTQWFARSEEFPGLCPAPFFSEELPFEAGQTLRFRYAIVVADGDADPVRAAALANHGHRTLTTPGLSGSG